MAEILETVFEKDFRERLTPLTRKLRRIEDRITDVVESSLKGAQRSTTYWNAVRRQIDNLYREMVQTFDGWAKEEIPARYRRSLAAIQRRINQTKAITRNAQRNITSLLSTQATRATSLALYSDAADSFLSSAITGRQNLHRFTRITQQTLINESFLDLNIAAGIEFGDLRKAADSISNRLWTELHGLAENQRFVQAGSRKFTPSYYAELVARTKFHESHTAAAMAQAANYRTDLLQVSSHNTTSAICVPFEAKIFSVGGIDKRFPPLVDTPPFHPNCLHLLFPTFVEAMEVQKTLDSFSSFSRDKISKPPVPAGFVPVDKRKLA